MEQQQAGLRLYLLGPFRLEKDGAGLTLRTRKTALLLAYLALHPEVHFREELAALLWGEAKQEAARVSLRQELSALRRVLGEDALDANRQIVQLNPRLGLWVDVLELQQKLNSVTGSPQEWQAAVALYQGDLLPDFYEDWVLSERRLVKRQYIAGLLKLVQYHRAQSHYTQAVQMAQRILEIEPIDERAHQHLMVCFTATGDRAAALRQYEMCVNILRDELGVVPAPETQALYRRLQTNRQANQAETAQLTNLPSPLTSFVGRLAALEEVENRLQPLQREARGVRLLTLVGIGGCGKTRLAIQVGHELVDDYQDGVWWVDLAPLADGSFILPAIASALGVQPAPETALEQRLVEHLRKRQMLLVLDNCEHVLAACSDLAGRLLADCPQLQMLATSREALHAAGEVMQVVPPLELPGLVPPYEEAALLDVESVRLFVERATVARSDFQLDASNRQAVAEICCRLDGLPLAIELAAARVHSLSCAQINQRLEDRFKLLSSGGNRQAPARQQTLRSLIDWSYSLLAPVEQILYRRLAVFAGGWSLEAAEPVCAGAGLKAYAVLDVLSALVDKSLVNAKECGAAMRYSFLETLREYARERLDEAEEGDRMQSRHLDYFLALAKSTAPLLADEQGQSAWLECLDADQENLRQAIAWAIAQHSPHSLRLAGALWPFWELSAPLAGDQGWLPRATQISGPEALVEHARSLARAGALAWQQGDQARAHWLHELALALYRQTDDRRGLASVLNNLAAQFHAQANYERAEALYMEGLQAARQSGDRMLISAALNNLGIMAMETQRYETAQQFLLEAAQAARQDGNQTKIAIALHNLGEVERSRGAYPEALAYYQQSLAESQQAGYRLGQVMNNWGCGAMHFRLGEAKMAVERLRQGIELAGALETSDWAARCLAWLGLVESQLAPGERAVRLLAAAETLDPERDYLVASGILLAEYEQALAGLRGRIGKVAFESAWQEGGKYSLAQAVAFVQFH